MVRLVTGIVFFGLIVLCFCLTACGDGKGIITLQGYKEAVALCGHEHMAAWITSKEMGNVLFYPEYTLVVNEGHTMDKEVNTLKAAALIRCGGY